jgi:DNA-binding GntR family transcriptional regulator
MTRHAPTSKAKTVSAPERPETLTEQAYKQIEELIVTLRLKPGQVLSEQSLSASLGIGRTPIREALQKLALEGLVTILPRKGILVSEINPHSQLRVLEARREIERLLSRASAERPSSASFCSASWPSRVEWKRPRGRTTTSSSCVSTGSSIN